MQNYSEWFAAITQKPDQPSRTPFPYQEQLVTAPELPILLNVPTGAGKTAAAVLSWLWRRHYANEETRQQTPRRLIYCLPMRTLVEQTYSEVKGWLKQAGLSNEVGLHLLMGGAVSNRWEADPEKDCILIGTQDQLLSRALNRGYGMSRYKWPIHFALLNNDCLWVMDEVQLMGAGLRTTAQLQGFREIFETYGTTRSLWMSATLDPELLKTVDYKPDLSQTLQLTDADLLNETLKLRMQAQKRLYKAKTELSGKEKDDAKELAKEVIEVHHPGSLTLVICNRVSRAQELYKALEKQTNEELTLIHSRFRAAERQSLNQKLRENQLSGILVATQAIEAGVDISARTLFSELAPWSSLVQRFGRCNRYGEYSDTASVYWIDIPDLKKNASPYKAEQLEKARSLLKDLNQVGPEALKNVKAPKEEIEGLIPRQHDLLQLFDTSTDLAGHDIDISSFIRETDENDVAIAWRDWSEPKPSEYLDAIQQQELCRVSIGRAREFLDRLKKQNQKAWVRDGLKGWQEATTLCPGMTLLLHSSAGGYDPLLGFTGNTPQTPAVEIEKQIIPDQYDSDHLSKGASKFVKLIDHSQDVAEEVETLCKEFPAFDLPVNLLIKAGRWHDAGKAHPVFQTALTHNRPDRVGETLWAKSDHDFQNPADRHSMPPDRRGFRHELVSALLALQEQEDFLLCYLVACHHGKVRMSIQPRPTEKPTGVERFALGVHHGDRVHDQLAEIDLGAGLKIKSQEISLDCMGLGDGKHGPSWVAQALALLEEYGPFKLTFLETLIRIADWRVSAKDAPEILEETDD